MATTDAARRPRPARTIIPEFPKLPEGASAAERGQAVLAWWQASRPARALTHNGAKGAAVMAAGMAYMALFSLFAGLWAGFSIAGLVLTGRPELMQSLIEAAGSTVPGLIGEDAAIKPSLLLNAGVFGWTGAISLVGAVWTALNWLNGARTAIRTIFDIPPTPDIGFALAKLRDFGLVLGAVVLVMLSSALAAAGAGAVQAILESFGIGGDWVVRDILIRAASFVLAMLVDAALLAGMLRVLSRVRIPRGILWPAALVGGFAIGVIKLLAGELVGGATANPLLATFAVLLSILILFNLMATVQLLLASWVKVSMDDAGAAPRLLTVEAAAPEAAAIGVQAERARLAVENLRLREDLRDKPRFARWSAMRRARRIAAERRALEQHDLERRMWHDAPHSTPPDDAPDGADESGAGDESDRRS